MIVTIPSEYDGYLKRLLSYGYADSESGVIQKLFTEGLKSVLEDLQSRGERPDIAPSFIECPKEPYEKQTVLVPNADSELIGKITEYWHLPVEHTNTIIFVIGFDDGYACLRWSFEDGNKYKSDPLFRELVEGMPHEVAFNDDEDIYEIDLIAVQNKSGFSTGSLSFQ